MRKFILNCLLFILPGMILFGWFEMRVRQFKNVTSQRVEALSEPASPIEVLVLGNSHSGDGVDPRQFDMHTYNIAQGSQSLYFDIEITKKYLDNLSSLKYVLISMDYHSLYFTHSEVRDFMYSHYYGIRYKDQGFDRSDISLSLYGYGLETSWGMMNREPLQATRGWWGSHKKTLTEKLTAKKAQQRVQSFDKMIEKNKDERLYYLNKLNDFIVELKSRNVTPVFLTLPGHNYYVQALDSSSAARNASDVESLCKKHDLTHFNFINDIGLPDTIFYNVDHLNRTGAVLYSQKINEALNALEQH